MLDGRRAIYAGVIFWSALLLLLVQPILAKALLPWFGGSAGVWTTSMLLFQVLLLVGYAYAHLLAGRFSPRTQFAVHTTLLLGSLFFLPLRLSREWQPAPGGDPSLQILMVLGRSVGLPYLLLSTTSPLLQAWFVRTVRTKLPWRLFAVSNFGSLVALLSYPVMIEPWLTVGTQLLYWSAGYLLFAGGCITAGAFSLRQTTEAVATSRPVAREFALWLGLATTPSVLWLAVGNQVSQEIAAVPFLWIAPLALYLLSFVLCFDSDRWYRPRLFRWILPLGWAGIVAVVSQRGYIELRWAIPVLMLSLFLCCMFCHGELARRRPQSGSLTAYYLTVAAGGALGGLFVSVVAPNIFDDFLELPVGVLACLLLALAPLYGLSGKRVARVGAVVAAAAVAAIYTRDDQGEHHISTRNFYGVLQVNDSGTAESKYRSLLNGTIQHGLQFLAPDRSRIPNSYYGPASGVAIVLGILNERGPVHAGVIGLGTGTMAAYARAGDRYRFYEINPAVTHLANTEFRYLRESPAPVEVVPGDARLSMEREQPQSFNLLVVDAFSGDSIPVHLLTREAFDTYFRHMSSDGAIAVHVTNKHLDLPPVVKLSAESTGARALLIHNSKEDARKIYSSSWMIVTKDLDLIRRLEWLSSPVRIGPRHRIWTDNYSNLLTILK